MCIIENLYRIYKLYPGKGCYARVIQEQKEKIGTSAFQSKKLIQFLFTMHPNYCAHYLKTLTQGKKKYRRIYSQTA